MKKAPEERLQWRKLINRQEDQHCGKLWEPRKQSRVCSKHFLNGKPTEAYPYPIENLGYTSTFKQKKKRKTLVRKESIKTEKKQKKYTFRNMVLYSRENRPVVPIIWPVLHCQFLVAYSRDVENIYIHCQLLLQHCT